MGRAPASTLTESQSFSYPAFIHGTSAGAASEVAGAGDNYRLVLML